MASDAAIIQLPRGRVLAECGPMRMVIAAWLGRIIQPEEAARAAAAALALLDRVAALRPWLARRPESRMSTLGDPVAEEMVQSVLRVGDEDLTPMAAVAGSLSDAVADFLEARGMTRIIVDNGGDVAVRVRDGGEVRVGICTEPGLSQARFLLRLEARERSSWGVATSGLGGRSFTRGIATAATVVADRASLADAAATAVANACTVDDPGVRRLPARELDPDTDIPDLPVTVHVGGLSAEARREALGRALRKASSLVGRGVVLGAFVAVGGLWGMTPSLRPWLEECGGSLGVDGP